MDDVGVVARLQYEKDSDLAKFFHDYVPKAQPGDEKVSKFVGDPDKQQAGVEASLDIQYEMGVAPHLKAEFWMFAGQDFCKVRLADACPEPRLSSEALCTAGHSVLEF